MQKASSRDMTKKSGHDMVRSALVLFTTVAALAGCTHWPHEMPASAPVEQPDPVERRLADAADRAVNAMETLAMIEQARTPQKTVQPVRNAPPELMRPVSIDWVGPIETLAERLAARAGYRFLTIGDAPPVPIVVTLNEINVPVIDAMRSIGLQAGNRAVLAVDANAGRVELRYDPNEGRGAE